MAGDGLIGNPLALDRWAFGVKTSTMWGGWFVTICHINVHSCVVKSLPFCAMVRQHVNKHPRDHP